MGYVCGFSDIVPVEMIQLRLAPPLPLCEGTSPLGKTDLWTRVDNVTHNIDRTTRSGALKLVCYGLKKSKKYFSVSKFRVNAGSHRFRPPIDLFTQKSNFFSQHPASRSEVCSHILKLVLSTTNTAQNNSPFFSKKSSPPPQHPHPKQIK